MNYVPSTLSDDNYPQQEKAYIQKKKKWYNNKKIKNNIRLWSIQALERRKKMKMNKIAKPLSIVVFVFSQVRILQENIYF
jgi:hypothetical protein